MTLNHTRAATSSPPRLLTRPVLGPLLVIVVALVFRVVDIFVLRLDERLGEIILSKAVGIALVLAVVWRLGQRPSDIGMGRHRLALGVAAGVAVAVVTFGAGLAAQLAVLPEQAAVVVTAVDPTTGLAGGALFGTWLVVGNVVNATMEEGLFRGLVLTRFRLRLPAATANAAQAALFAGWHLVWPIRDLVSGQPLRAVLPQAGLLLTASFIAGLAYGHLRLVTGTVWAPWTVHLINNTLLNLLHVQGADGALQPLTVTSVVAVTLLLGVLVLRPPITRGVRE